MNEFLGVLAEYWNDTFAQPDSSFYGWFLLFQLVLVAGFYWFRIRPKNSYSLIRMFSWIFPRRFYLSRQFFNDCSVAFINFLLAGLAFAGNTGISLLVASGIWYGTDAVLGTPGFQLTGMTAAMLMAFSIIVASDLGAFVAHWMQHRIPVLWEFHKVHHSAETLTPVTGLRSHPVDLVLITVVTGVFMGVVYGVAGYLSDGKLSALTIVGVNMFNFLFILVIENLQHSHVPMSFGWFDRVLISPLMHQVHHSKDPAHLDRNFGQIFSVWDRLAGTRVLPVPGKQLRFGLSRPGRDDFSKLTVIYLVPFYRAAQIVVRWIFNRLHSLFYLLSIRGQNNAQK